MKNIIILAGMSIIILLTTSCSYSIPDDWKGTKLFNMVDSRDYIIINNDNTFILHEYIPNAQQEFEWRGRVENLELMSNNELKYQGSNDFKPTEIDSQMKLITESIYGEHLQIDFTGFNTINGSYETEKRRYSTRNVSPY
jgi:hypothetical protein